VIDGTPSADRDTYQMIPKQHILDEIKRTAAANGGVALGWRRFMAETGIRAHDWEPTGRDGVRLRRRPAFPPTRLRSPLARRLYLRPLSG
jgi:hypothetical protein